MHDTCITHKIRRRYAQSSLKLTPKYRKVIFTCQFFMKVDPKVPPIRDLETQKRPNTEPQGVPEALETLIR